MKRLRKIYCRTFQGIFKYALYLMPWRKPKLISGENSFDEMAEIIKSKGYDTVLIVTDQMIMKLKLIDPLIEKLKERQINVVIYDKTVPNPSTANIEEAYLLYKDKSCKALIAFGGGSPMDCAKGVGIKIVKPDKSIDQMKGLLKVRKRLPNLFAIPTTAGTGSEATLAAVISNKDTHEKYPINDFVLIPTYAILEPKLTVGLPKHITSTTGMDALTHAVEAYIGWHSTTKETALMSKKAVKLIFDNIKIAYDESNNLEARMNMQLAAHYAGIAFTRSYVGYVHSMAHALGAIYNTPHGLANAVLLPYLLDEYGKSAYAPLSRLADVVGIEGSNQEEKAKLFIQAIKDLNAYMQIPSTLEIKEEDIPVLSKKADKEGNPLYPVPKLMDSEEIAAVYKKVMTK